MQFNWTSISRPLRFAVMAFFVSLPFALAAQNGNGEEIDWDDEDDTVAAVETGPAVPAAVGKRDAALIYKDGVEFTIGETVELGRNDTISVSVRHLLPNSWIAVHIKKGGVILAKKGFFANQQGELDLEVQTGGKKLSGTATIIYHASSGKKNEVNCKVEVD